MEYRPGKGDKNGGTHSERHQEGPLFSVRIASHGQNGVLFLSGKVLSVIHRAWSDVSRPRRYHFAFLPCFDSGGIPSRANWLCSFVLFGWDLGPVVEIPPFVLFSCAIWCVHEPIAGRRVGGSIGATAVRRLPVRIEVHDESDRIDLSEQPYCLSTWKCSKCVCARISDSVRSYYPARQT